jgi:hypothetical protein
VWPAKAKKWRLRATSGVQFGLGVDLLKSRRKVALACQPVQPAQEPGVGNQRPAGVPSKAERKGSAPFACEIGEPVLPPTSEADILRTVARTHPLSPRAAVTGARPAETAEWLSEARFGVSFGLWPLRRGEWRNFLRSPQRQEPPPIRRLLCLSHERPSALASTARRRTTPRT